ncbi:dTDP-4-dehydrorhamnose reductase [Stutzerimonas tarimensis]|uniref:dTDP-4-dehydrorhamnose reductase n=1 Tax=Stutzerimonas tarimensis TaxID=1507735 RepID=A0ABV7T6E1_9GAMM
MRILVCGASGQVGHELIRRGTLRGLQVTGLSHAELDITDESGVSQAVRQLRPELIVNAAAFTQVDAAESRPEIVYAVNRDGVRYLARAAREHAVPVLHMSTDYVFSGDSATPYRESDPTSPTGVYGSSKLAGEQVLQEELEQALILRTSWVFGAHGRNFVKTMLRLGTERDVLSVVDDQVGCPTFAGGLAEVLLELASRYAASGNLRWGLYHYSGSPTCSWFGFANEIFRQAAATGLLARVPDVKPIATAQYPTPARRPAWSVLDSSLFQETFGITARDWRDDLAEVIGDLSNRPTCERRA